MSYKRIFFILIGGFIALLLMNTNIEVTAGDFTPTPTPIPWYACPAGQYGVESPDRCVDADPGHYVPEANATEQTPCAPGYYQPNSGAVECIPAAPGFYVPDPAATEQLACLDGYTSEAAAIVCTPVEAGYTFTGFFTPVDMAALNVVKAGRAIPIKFSLGGDYGLDIMAAGYPASTAVACDSNLLPDNVEETVSAGSSSLSYDPDSDQYTYVWKTDRTWANNCRILTIMLDDDSVHQASFSLTR